MFKEETTQVQRGCKSQQDAGLGCRMQEMWGSVAGRTLQAYWARCTLTNFPPRVEGDSPGPLPGSCTRGIRGIAGSAS